ncbi:MAG: hypothetical protein QXX84_07330 [Sulfolobales archaeon]
MRLLARGEASSLYGAIVMSLILVIFASLYSSAVANLSRQGEAYREAFRGLLEASSENLDLYLNTSSGGIYAYTGSGARIVYIAVSNGSSIVMAMNKSIKLEPGSRVEVLSKDQLQQAASSRGFLAVFTERGRVYIYRFGDGGIANTSIVLSAVRGIYYAINTGLTSYSAYYYQNGVRMNITTYRWDIDNRYIIFQSPIDGYIYLEETPAELGMLNTTSWFNPPSVSYQKPSVTISFPPPWSATRTHDLYSVLMDTVSYTYDPILGVKVSRQIVIIPSSAVGSVSRETYLSWGATYTATLTLADMPSGWSISITTNRLSPGDLGIVGASTLICYYDWGYLYYRPTWAAQVASYSSTQTTLSISLGIQILYIPTDRDCYIYPPLPATPTHTWIYGLTAQGTAKTYSNATIYKKQDGLVTASNGNKIYIIDDISIIKTK